LPCACRAARCCKRAGSPGTQRSGGSSQHCEAWEEPTWERPCIAAAATHARGAAPTQGSLGAVVAALRGTELDTGLDPAVVTRLSVFWEQTRGLYAPFESSLRASSADVYDHEMPGGQYTNLKFQSLSLGALRAPL
jgi:Conserved carboxylase domain